MSGPVSFLLTISSEEMSPPLCWTYGGGGGVSYDTVIVAGTVKQLAKVEADGSNVYT